MCNAANAEIMTNAESASLIDSGYGIPDNIVMYPDYEYDSLDKDFRQQLEDAALSIDGRVRHTILICVMKYFGDTLPKEDAGVIQCCYQNKRKLSTMGDPLSTAFHGKMLEIEKHWGVNGNGYMYKEHIKVYVFYHWPSRETIERVAFQAGEDAATSRDDAAFGEGAAGGIDTWFHPFK